MTDYTASRPENAAAEPEGQGTAAQPDTATPQTEEAKIAALVETLARENADHKDRLLRTLAEMENLRKRTEREVADTRQYGIASSARDVLAVADNMERALQTLGAELRETANPGVKALLDSPHLTNLQELLLYGDPVDDDCVRRLEERFPGSRSTWRSGGYYDD